MLGVCDDFSFRGEDMLEVVCLFLPWFKEVALRNAGVDGFSVYRNAAAVKTGLPSVSDLVLMVRGATSCLVYMATRREDVWIYCIVVLNTMWRP